MPFDLRSVPVKQVRPEILVHMGFNVPEQPEKTLKAMHHQAAESARVTFNLYGEVPAFWLLCTFDRFIVVRTEWKGDSEKDLMTGMLAHMVEVLGVTRYTLIHEAYSANYPVNTDKETATPPSQLPKSQRDEILFVVSCDRDGRQLFSRFLITQRPKPALPLLGPRVDITDEGRMTGRMFLFPGQRE